MKKTILLFLILASLFSPLSGHAQENPTITNLLIQFWPEYDRSEMLVIYEFTVSEDVSLPVSLVVRIPVAAGEPNAVAFINEAGSLLNAEFQSQTVGIWSEVALLANSRTIHLEYYDPGLDVSSGNRKYDFFWPGDYLVEAVQLKAQHPFDASNYLINGQAGIPVPGGDGMSYTSLDLGAWEAGQTFEITVSYDKPSDTLSVTQLVPQSSAVQPQPAAESSAPPEYLPWGLGILGVGLIFYGIYSSRQQARSTRGRKRSHGNRKPAKKEPAAGGKGVFCHSCGELAQGGDKYCRNCGAKLRI